MTSLIRSRTLLLAALVAATALSACGGGSDSGGSGKPAGRDAAQDRKDMARIIKQGFGPNAKARSGRLDGTIDLDVKGIARFTSPVEITASGGFELRSGATTPDFRIDLGLLLNDHSIGGELVLLKGDGFIQLGTTGYKLPAPITAKLAAPAAALDNGLAKTAGMFFIRPDRWQKAGHIVGDADVDGVATEHATAGIKAGAFFEDVARLFRTLTLLRVTEAVGLPEKVTPAQRAALGRSVVSAKGDVYLGKDDHVLRQAHLEGKIVVARKDRKILGGMTGATLVGDVKITDVGKPQNIKGPPSMGSYDELQISLDVLGAAIRKDLRSK